MDEFGGHLVQVEFDAVADGFVFDFVEPVGAVVEHGDGSFSFHPVDVPVHIVLAEESGGGAVRCGDVFETVALAT